MFTVSDRPSSRITQPVWPLPSLMGRAPAIVPTESKSAGLDLAYADDSAQIFMPDMMPAFAVSDGIVTYAGKQLHGYAVVIDHKNGWASYYANLEHMFAKPTHRATRARTERLKAGDVIGYVGAPQPGALKRLHFELWKLGIEGHYEPIDPHAIMRSWLVMPWHEDVVSVSRVSATV